MVLAAVLIPVGEIYALAIFVGHKTSFPGFRVRPAMKEIHSARSHYPSCVRSSGFDRQSNDVFQVRFGSGPAIIGVIFCL